MYIIITSLKPDESLIKKIRPLEKAGRTFVAAVPETAEVPEELFDLARVVTSCGSGRGDLIKSALRFIETEAAPEDAVASLDPECAAGPDAAEAFLAECECMEGDMLVGCFADDKKKRPAVRLSRWFLKLTEGVSLSDPFCSLRCFKAALIPQLLELKGGGCEYESRCLVLSAKNGLTVREARIPGSSPAPPAGFSSIRASGPIFRVLIAFILSSLSSFTIDYAAFLLFSFLLGLIPGVYEAHGRSLLPVFGTQADIHIIALVLARCVSSLCNFTFNRKLVFKSGGRSAIIRYYVLLIVMLLLNSGLFTLITGEHGLPAWLAQPAVQIILYPLNFILQRKWVFRDKKQ